MKRELSAEETKYWRRTRLMAVLILIVMPIWFLIVVQAPVWATPTVVGKEWIIYLLLFILAFYPALSGVLKKSLLKRAAVLSKRKPPAYWFYNLAYSRFALGSASFIAGLAVYLLWHDMTRMLWFYPIGLFWAVIFWPRKAEFMAFLEEFEANVTRA